MDGRFAKEYLHGDLREVREAIVWKLDGLGEYDARRPLTHTGTSLAGLVKHLAFTEAWYFGDAFGRPFPGRPRWDADVPDHLWVNLNETVAGVVELYRESWVLADATIEALDIDSVGHVPWWPSPSVKLFNILVHVLAETSRHAGHADILREHLDNGIGTTSGNASLLAERDDAFWDARRTAVEHAARLAAPTAEVLGP